MELEAKKKYKIILFIIVVLIAVLTVVYYNIYKLQQQKGQKIGSNEPSQEIINAIRSENPMTKPSQEIIKAITSKK